MRKLLAASVVVCSAMGVAVAGDLKSGLQEGDAPPAFNVKDSTGPSEGKSLCYRCKYGARPVVNIFAREITPELTKIIKELDAVVGKNQDKKMAGFVVLLTEDVDAADAKLKELAKKEGIKNIPLTVFDGVAGPEDYKIAKDAQTTVMMWVESKVKVNHAFAKGELKADSAKQLVADTAKILN
jgi:hypothetical protein